MCALDWMPRRNRSQPPFYRRAAGKIAIGNFEDGPGGCAEADWIIEVVAEIWKSSEITGARGA